MMIDTEQRADATAISKLLDRCFGPRRHLKTVQKLRKDRLPAEGLAFTFRDELGHVIGTLRFWHILAGGVPALLLGPMAIAPHWQRRGLGETLMHHGLMRAKELGHRAVLLVGDAPYYSRFGFTRALTLNLQLPGPVQENRFLGLELEAGALADTRGLVSATGQKLERKALKRSAA